jgi:hypothetical protein
LLQLDIPGVTPRHEYGIEILVVLAFLVYLIGISLDKACGAGEVYRDAKWSANDGRLGEEGRKHRIAELEGRLCEVLLPHPLETTPEMPPHECDFTNLVNELGRLVMAEELFTFVLEPEVKATNNGMERELRNPALERKAGRTMYAAEAAAANTG